MADVSDVQAVLVGLCAGFLYPNGTAQPSVVSTVQGITIYAGWPDPDVLDRDLAAKINEVDAPICHVTVWPLPAERNTTTYLQKWVVVGIDPHTISIAGSGLTITLSGTVATPQHLAVFVNGKPYVYPLQPTDALSSIAAALATLIAADFPGTVSAGPLVTLPASARLGDCRVGTQGTVMRELARQEKQFQVSIWADTPENRAAIAKVIDPALKALTFINLPDFSAGRIRSFGSREIDAAEKSDIYRRDLIFAVDYATTQVLTAPQITVIGTTFTDAALTSPTHYE